MFRRIPILSMRPGVIALTAEHLVTLADFYHVSVDYLLGRTAKPEMNE